MVGRHPSTVVSKVTALSLVLIAIDSEDVVSFFFVLLRS
jgi:hypothetical protein